MLNEARLMGRLIEKPQLRQTNSGKVYCTFKLATNEKYKDRSGETKEEVDYHDCTAWGKTGETIEKFFDKGKPILVLGKVKNNQYTNKDGVKMYGYRIRVSSFVFLPINEKTPSRWHENKQESSHPSDNWGSIPGDNSWGGDIDEPPF